MHPRVVREPRLCIPPEPGRRLARKRALSRDCVFAEIGAHACGRSRVALLATARSAPGVFAAAGYARALQVEWALAVLLTLLRGKVSGPRAFLVFGESDTLAGQPRSRFRRDALAGLSHNARMHGCRWLPQLRPDHY